MLSQSYPSNLDNRGETSINRDRVSFGNESSVSRRSAPWQDQILDHRQKRLLGQDESPEHDAIPVPTGGDRDLFLSSSRVPRERERQRRRHQRATLLWSATLDRGIPLQGWHQEGPTLLSIAIPSCQNHQRVARGFYAMDRMEISEPAALHGMVNTKGQGVIFCNLLGILASGKILLGQIVLLLDGVRQG